MCCVCIMHQRLSTWQRFGTLPIGIVFFALKGCEETLKFMDIYYANRTTQIASCIDGILGPPIHGLTVGPSYELLASACSAQFDADRALALAQYLCNMILTASIHPCVNVNIHAFFKLTKTFVSIFTCTACVALLNIMRNYCVQDRALHKIIPSKKLR